MILISPKISMETFRGRPNLARIDKQASKRKFYMITTITILTRLLLELLRVRLDFTTKHFGTNGGELFKYIYSHKMQIKETR